MSAEMRMLPTIFLLLAAAYAPAQQTGQNKPPGESRTFTVTVKSQLVVETVVVKDKRGKLIPGLTAQDFAITEDGAPQKITFCEHQDLAANASPLPVALPGSEELKLYKRLARTQVTPETPDSERYKNRRLLALYF